mmetsp:Transcript_16776/g.48711  ORF Transcript_16776/g.48711 Transcript_16776/m.48711 type:complete len:220 (+) Transcript_16776:347-1006(+)
MISTSGTATPFAVPQPKLPCAMPTTSTSGITLWSSRRAARARRAATRNVSLLGATWSMSSRTSSSQLVAERAGLATGKSVGFRTSGLGGQPLEGRFVAAWALPRRAPHCAHTGCSVETLAHAARLGLRGCGVSRPISAKALAFDEMGLGGDTLKQHMSAYTAAPARAKPICESSRGAVAQRSAKANMDMARTSARQLESTAKRIRAPNAAHTELAVMVG